MADAGSEGEASFQGLRKYVIEAQSETIKALLNIVSIGLAACNRVSELIDDRSIDIDRSFAAIEANRDMICGVKARASQVIVTAWGHVAPAKIAKRVAEITGLPLMVQVGEPGRLIDEVLDILTPDDIVTHCFNDKKAGSIRGTAALFAQAKQMAADGIFMDIGHGQASSDFKCARGSVVDGLLPYSISTDLHLRNIKGPVHDLATTLPKLLAVGVPFDECIAAVTRRPPAILGLGVENGATPGVRAHFTLFDLAKTTVIATDSSGNTLAPK